MKKKTDLQTINFDVCPNFKVGLKIRVSSGRSRPGGKVGASSQTFCFWPFTVLVFYSGSATVEGDFSRPYNFFFPLI